MIANANRYQLSKFEVSHLVSLKCGEATASHKPFVPVPFDAITIPRMRAKCCINVTPGKIRLNRVEFP